MGKSAVDSGSEDTTVRRLLSFSKKDKQVRAHVTLLDGRTLHLQLQRNVSGKQILGEVCQYLEFLTEKYYFSLNYHDSGGQRFWLDLDKEAGKILKGDPWRLYLEVMFYPKDPSHLADFTRYLLCLQVRRDVLSGRLACSKETQAALGAYLVQAQLGDYTESLGAEYLSGFQFGPDSAPGLQERVRALHKGLRGETRSDSELHYLRTAMRLEMYGVDMHLTQDSDGVTIQLGVCATGIRLFQDKTKINRFVWSKVLEVSYRKKSLFLKVEDGGEERTLGFRLANREAAEQLWSVCVLQHMFFRRGWKMPLDEMETNSRGKENFSRDYFGGLQGMRVVPDFSGEGGESVPTDEPMHKGESVPTREPVPKRESVPTREPVPKRESIPIEEPVPKREPLSKLKPVPKGDETREVFPRIPEKDSRLQPMGEPMTEDLEKGRNVTAEDEDRALEEAIREATNLDPATNVRLIEFKAPA